MVKVLVVGGGSIGKRHIKNFKSLGCDVEGVEINADVRSAVEKDLKIKVHADLKAALEAGSYDAAVIAVPAKYHLECALAAVRNGINVLVEKPFFLDIMERHAKETDEQYQSRVAKEKQNLTELFQLIQEKNLVAMIGYMNRHSEPVKTLKKLIGEKVIGELVSIHSENSHNAARMHPGFNPGAWFIGHKEIGGDTMLEDSHGIDLLLHLFGPIEEVSCMTAKVTNTTVTSNDQAEMLVRFKNSTYGTVHTDLYCELSRAHVLVRGVNGLIIWDRQGDNNVKVIRSISDKINEEKIYVSKENRDAWFVNEAKEFLDCIQAKRMPNVEYDLKSGYETMKVIMAGSLSNKEGRRVKISEIFTPY